MPSLMSMEDLFYGPAEPTWIVPTEYVTPQASIDEPLRPVERYVEPGGIDRSIRPVERVARRIHTVPERAPIHAPHEEIRKVVEVPVPVPVPVRAPHEEIRKVVEVPVPVPVHVPVVPAPDPAPPVVVKRSVTPPIQRPIIHHPIELKVPMCCEKCAKKVKDRLLDLEGVKDVVIDQYNQKVIVYGPADPARVLNRVKLVKKRSAFWDLTVDYSENYRRYRAALAEAAEADAARAAKAKSQAQLVAPSRSEVVVQLPQGRDDPPVTAILPERLPYVANSRVHSVRYVSPPRAYREERFYNGRRHPDRPLY